MKYIVYSFNYPTLCRALRYIDEQWGKENTTLIFASMVSELPDAVAQSYNVVRVNGRQRSKIHAVKGVIADCLIARDSWKALDSVLKKIDEECTLVVFRDNEPQEATIIEKAFQKYSGKLHLWIIEEGVGLYARGRAPIKKAELKKIAYKIAGISSYALTSNPQGLHEKLEKVICQRPEAVEEKYADRNLPLEKQLEIFVPEFNKRFAEYVLGVQDDSQSKYNYAFLTIPMTDTAVYDESGKARYDEFLCNLVQLATQSGKLLIKSHPRDYSDYSKYAINDRVKVCSVIENSIPFECLNAYFGEPQIITPGSSSAINSSGDKPVINVNALLGMGSVSKSEQEKMLGCGIVVCETLDDLKAALKK